MFAHGTNRSDRSWRMGLAAAFTVISLLSTAGPAFAGDLGPQGDKAAIAAHGTNSQPKGVDPLTQLDPKDQQLVNHKEAQFADFARAQDAAVNRPNAPVVSNVLNVPVAQQETSYWCGPASTQMVLWYQSHYYSQSYLANREGTTASSGTSVGAIGNTLNALTNRPTSWWVWEPRSTAVFGTFMGYLDFDLNYNEPTVLNVQTNPPDGTPYKLAGYVGNYRHYIVGHGHYGTGSTNDTMTYTDPYQDSSRGAGVTLGRHTTYAYNLFWVVKANGGWVIY